MHVRYDGRKPQTTYGNLHPSAGERELAAAAASPGTGTLEESVHLLPNLHLRLYHRPTVPQSESGA